MPDSGPVLPLPMAHLRRPLAVLLDRSHPAHTGLLLFSLLRAQNDLQHLARILQRRLELISRTSPILVASSANTCDIATLSAAKLQASQKTAIPASSSILHMYSLTYSPAAALRPRELRPIINLLPHLAHSPE